MWQAVLLVHHLGDGSSHYDWMLEVAEGDDPEERALLTFHVDSRIDQISAQSFAAARIDDHRRLYLEYEGEIAGGRGEVRPLAAGRIVEMKFTDVELVAVIDWGETPIEYRGRAGEDGSAQWRFTAAPALSR